MELNISKWNIITYRRSGDGGMYIWELGGDFLKRVDRVRDFSIITSSSLSHRGHIST